MSRLSALVTYGGDESDDAESNASSSGVEDNEASMQVDGENPGDDGVTAMEVGGTEDVGPGETSEAENENDEGITDGAGVYPFSTAGISIPPAPPGECVAYLQERVRTFMAKKGLGQHFNEKLRKNKEFQNPHICEKLVEHLGLDEFGSCCPKDIFDPNEFGEDMEYDKLATRQRQNAAARAREQAKRSQIDFHSPSAPSPPQGVAALVNTAAARAAAAGALARLVPQLAKKP